LYKLYFAVPLIMLAFISGGEGPYGIYHINVAKLYNVACISTRERLHAKS